MKKRLLSLVLVVCMALSLLPTTVLATPISEIKYDQVPTGVHWSEDGDLMWESDYFTNYPEDFRGFQIKFRYTTDDVEGVTDPETLNWTEHYIDDYGNYREYVTTCPNMGDFAVPADAWYCFAVCAYGETDYADDGYAYWYYSEWSDWSEPMYFEKGDAMAPPANVKWDGATMNWTVDSVDNIDHFEVQVYYKDSEGYQNTIRQFSVYPEYRQTVFCETLEEHYIDEDDLLYNGSRDYYFKVYAVSKSTLVAADSPWAISDNTLTFNANAEKLATPTGLAWDGTTMTWDKVDGVAYDVELYVKEEPDEEKLAQIAAELGIDPSELTDEILEANGFGGEYCTHTYECVTEFPVLDNSVLSSNPGAYTFRVRARSTDLSKYLSSEWSERSGVKEMDGELTLSQVTNVTISSDGVLSWSWNGSDAEQAALDGFSVEVYYKATADDTAVYQGRITTDGLELSTTAWKRYATKDGLYSFAISTETNDYAAFYDSEYTEIGADFTYDAPDPVGTLTDLTWNGSTATWTFTGNADLVEYYYVDLYYCGADGTEYSGGSSVYDGNSHTFGGEDFENWGNGVYKFKVRAYSKDTDTAAHSDWVESPALTYTKPSAKLDVPTGLYWDDRTMKWDVPADTSDIAYYEVRYLSDSEPEGNRWATAQPGKYIELDQWLINVLGDNITFMLRAVSADATAYADSDWVTCGTYYVKPDGMNAPTGAAWNGTTMTWDWDGGEYSNMLDRYMIALYYAANANETPRQISMMSVRNDTMLELGGWAVNAEKSGLYYFTVYAQSRDETVIGNSEPSAMSPALNFTPAEKLAAPSNVAWNGTCVTWTHSADWEAELVDHYLVRLYKGDMHVKAYWIYGNSCRQVIPSEVFENEGSGTYTVTVQAMSSDYAVRSNSVVVSGANLTYKPATASLSAPTNVKWNNTTMTWDAVTDGTVGAYQVRFYNPANVDDYYEAMVAPGGFPSLSQRRINELGDTIYFKVRALTADANAYNDSEWVECQQTYTLPEALPTPTNLTWSADGVMSWSWDNTCEQAAYLRNFIVKLYYSATKTGTATLLDSFSETECSTDWWFNYAVGDGWYSFEVCANSTNYSECPNSGISKRSAAFYYDAPDPVAPPRNLSWNGSMATWDSSKNEGYLVTFYDLELYYYGVDGTSSPEIVYLTSVSWDKEGFLPSSSTLANYGNGYYGFAVRALSNDTKLASNSAWVFSEDLFQYTKADKVLSAPSNLRWEGRTAVWDVPEDEEFLGGYELCFYNEAGKSSRSYLEPGSFRMLRSNNITRLGNTIYFKVRALSGGVNNISDSDWAVCETPFVYGDAAVLNAPVNVVYDPNAGTVTWDAVEGAAEYKVVIYYSQTKDGEQKLVQQDTVTKNQYRFLGADGLGYYHVQVRALGDGFLYQDSANWGTHCCVPFLEKLPLSTPTGLIWNKEYSRRSDGNGGWKEYWEDVFGAMSWKRGVDQARYRVITYQVKEDGSEVEVHRSNIRYGSQSEMNYLSAVWFIASNPESGTYYFTVQALGDGVLYNDSAIAKSDTWTYIKPEEQMPTLTNVRWIGNNMVWDQPEDSSYYYGYELRQFFSETKNGEKQRFGGRISRGITGGKLHDEDIMQYGSGYYWFQVRQLSSDITKVANGAWSEMSTPYSMKEVVEEVNDTLMETLESLPENPTAEQVSTAVDMVKALDTEKLYEAMASDQSTGTSIEEGGTLDMIQKLEEATGVKTDVDVAGVPEGLVEDFVASKISVTGAALNVGTNDSVTLNIGAADPGKVIPTQYFNTVQFSMHLTDETGESVDMDADPGTAGQQLAVPVRITLPVPAWINPAFLVVLHHIESTGEYEEIQPYIYNEDMQWYASFVVTSFSDFALASVTIEAETTETGVQVTANFAVDLPGKAICAVYDEYGRLIGVTELESMTAGEQVLDITCDPGKAHTVKLFVLDGNGVPQYVESPCTLSSEG